MTSLSEPASRIKCVPVVGCGLALPTDHLERVLEAEHDAAVAAVLPPLVQEIRRADRGFGDLEVPGVGRIVEFRPKLQNGGFLDPGVPDEADIQVGDAVRAEDVARRGG